MFFWLACALLGIGARPALALTQTQSLVSCANVNGPGTVNWTNPERATTSDNQYATASGLDGTVSELLTCTGYGFAIPDGATINGITVSIERKSSSTGNGGSRDSSVRVLKAGTATGTDKASATTYTTADAVATYGAANDLWGTTWTPADINDANFGVAFSATKPSASGGSHTITVDQIQVTVDYTLGGGATQTQSTLNCANVDGPGTQNWTSPDLAEADDSLYAQASVDGTTSELLTCTGYGFAIPTGSVIDGIAVSIERKSSSTNNGGSRDASVRVLKAGVATGTDKASATTYTTTDTIVTYGAANDLWGTTWTPADINAGNFGVAFSATKPSATGGAHTITVDQIQVTVTYRVPTTLGDGTNPSNATVAPGSGITDLDAFTFVTASGSDSVTALTVTLTGTNSFQGLSEVRITNNAGTTTYFNAVANPGSNTVNFSGGTPIPVTGTAATFKIRITPKTHAAMPAPPGTAYTVGGTVTAFTNGNPQQGADSASATITVDNASPAAATSASGTPDNTRVTLGWTTSASSDFSRSVVLRWTGGAAGAEVPAEGTDYTVGNAIGTATVICVRTADAASTAVSGADGNGTGGCSATALTNGQAYTYKVFQKDANGNYDTGALVGSFTPGVRPTLSSASLVCGSSTQVEVLFSTAVTAATAQTAGNYTLSGGATVSAAVLGSDTRLVTLTVANVTPGTPYTLTVSNVAAIGGLAILPGSQITFFAESGFVPGLKGTYYAQNGNLGAAFAFTGNAVDRIDSQVNFDWANGTPGVAGIGADGFSVRWQGYVAPTVSGNYTFRTRSDDGVRLYVNGSLVINNWTDHASTNNDSTPIALTAGQYYPVIMEFYENGGQAVAELWWSGPSTGGFQFIPAANLWRCGGTPQPSAFYKLDETSWNGTAGEVADSSGNGNNGTATGGALPVAAKVCNGAQLNGSSRYVTVPNLSNLLNATASLAFWIKTTQAGNDTGWQAPGVSGVELSGGSDDIFWGWLDASGRIGVSVGNDYTTKSATAVNDGNWHHVVLTRDHTGGLYRIYIDGALNASGAIATGVIGTAFSSLGRIEDTGGSPEYLNGQLDEIRIYGSVLSDDQVRQVYSVTRACASSLSHYAITFPNGTTGVTCEPTDVLITAHDASDAAIAPTAGTIVGLSTSTGTGVWQTPAVSGTGTWGVSGLNDGIAQYTWPGTESSMRVRLRQNAVTPALTVVPTGGIGAVENSSISFADTAFRVTANGTSTTTVGTHISAKDTNVGFGAQTLYVQAVRTDTNTGSCAGLIPGQTVNVEMAAARINPTAGSSQVSVRNSGGGMTALNTGAGALGAYANVSLAFDAQSKAPLVINYPDAGSVTLSLRYQQPTPPAGTYVSGATGNFVVRPFGLRVSGPTTSASPAPTDAAFRKAGELFNVTLTAVQWKSGDDVDADGAPDSDAQISANAATPNFGQETSAATAVLSRVLNAPAGGNAGTLGGAVNFTGFTAGAQTQSVSWSEVGFINLKAVSSDYLGSGQAVANSSAGLTGVGRFYPDHFTLASSPAPLLTNRSASSCTPSSTFTYMNEGFQVGFTLEARNVANGVTQNYGTANGYAKLNPSTIAQLGFGARSGATVLTSRLDLSAGSSGTFTNGVAAVSATLALQRAAAPDGPYASLQIGIRPAETGTDGVAIDTLDLDADGTAGNERKNLGVSTEARFGRLRVLGRAGSSLVNMRVPLQVQYFNGTGFVRNSDDSCTTLAANTFTLSDYRVNLNACETAVSSGVTFSSGDASLVLAKPGGTNNGSLVVTANLGPASGSYCPTVGGGQAAASSAGRAYLQGNWAGAGWSTDPYARIGFGVYGSQPGNFVFQRENY